MWSDIFLDFGVQIGGLASEWVLLTLEGEKWCFVEHLPNCVDYWYDMAY